MPNLSSEGVFDVKVVAGLIKDDEWLRNKDPMHSGAFIITLKLETQDGLHAYFDLPFNKREITMGKYSGQTELQASESKLAEIGVPDGYLLNLIKCIDEDSLYCRVTMKWREYETKSGEKKRTLEAKYLNALPRAVDIRKVDLAAKLAALDNPPTAKQAPVPTASKAPATTKKERSVESKFVAEIPAPPAGEQEEIPF